MSRPDLNFPDPNSESLSGLSAFAELNPAESELITAWAHEKRLWPGQEVVYKGDPVIYASMLLSGFIKLKQAGLRGLVA